MELSTIARVTVLGGIFAACGTGGGGSVEGTDNPGGPFSGVGNPGASIYRNPGVFSGSGAPGVGAGNDITSLIAGVCLRLATICPASNGDQAACAALLQRTANEFALKCPPPNYFSAYLQCLLTAAIVCDINGQAASYSCVAPSVSSCGASGTTGATGGTGGNTGGTGGGGAGSGGTAGTAGTGGTGGRGRDGGRG